MDPVSSSACHIGLPAPDELIAEFLFLAKNPRAIRVCRQFFRIQSQFQSAFVLASFGIPIPEEMPLKAKRLVPQHIQKHVLRVYNTHHIEGTPHIDFLMKNTSSLHSLFRSAHHKDESLINGEIQRQSFLQADLQTLTLSKQHLVCTPLPLNNLSSLRVLRLDGNALATLPQSLRLCPNLQELECQNNQLEEFPPVLTSLPQLHLLDLSANKITSVPSWLPQLSSIKALLLNDNKIRVFPQETLSLPLSRLELAGNEIESVPSTIDSLASSLRSLSLHNNRIKSLPLSCRRLENLQYINLCGNPLEPPPLPHKISVAVLLTSQVSLPLLSSISTADLVEVHFTDQSEKARIEKELASLTPTQKVPHIVFKETTLTLHAETTHQGIQNER